MIADAKASRDRLLVLSCALEPYEVSFAEIPALKSMPKPDRGNFKIDEDGSYLYWPQADVHLDLDAIRTATCARIAPAYREAALRKKLTHDRRYGAAIARLRREKGLKQSAIAGLSERQVRRIERGEGVTSKALQRLAAAHGVGLGGSLEQIAEATADSGAAADASQRPELSRIETHVSPRPQAELSSARDDAACMHYDRVRCG